MKKLLSLLLSLSMLTSMAVMPAKAEETVMPLNASRIDSEKLPSGNLIYLGTASANVKEEDAVYSFPIYREGDLSEEASVTIHSLDLTAIYGEDYVILDDNAEKTGDGVSILERYATAEADTDETSDNISEENTDIENYSEFDSEMAQQFADEVVPDAMAGIEYSSGTTVTFAPGENEKTVKFKILDDKKSEGTEGFSLLLVNPDNAELYEVTSLSVNIEDDEPKEKSVVSFSRNSNIELYLKPQKSKNLFFIVRLFFERDNKRVEYVLLSAQDGDSIPSWDTWSRENELERKVRNDVWLQEELGVPPYKVTFLLPN